MLDFTARATGYAALGLLGVGLGAVFCALVAIAVQTSVFVARVDAAVGRAKKMDEKRCWRQRIRAALNRFRYAFGVGEPGFYFDVIGGDRVWWPGTTERDKAEQKWIAG